MKVHRNKRREPDATLAYGEPADDPVANLPDDGRWHPAEVRPGQWQARRSFTEGGCTRVELETDGDQPVRCNTEAKCQNRCNQLNRKLDRAK